MHALGTNHHCLHRPQKTHAGCSSLTSDQVYQWRLLLEEYGPTIVYIKGIHNIVVDAIS